MLGEHASHEPCMIPVAGLGAAEAAGVAPEGGKGVCTAASSLLPCAGVAGALAALNEFLVLRATGSLAIVAASCRVWCL